MMVIIIFIIIIIIIIVIITIIINVIVIVGSGFVRRFPLRNANLCIQRYDGHHHLHHYYHHPHRYCAMQRNTLYPKILTILSRCISTSKLFKYPKPACLSDRRPKRQMNKALKSWIDLKATKSTQQTPEIHQVTMHK